MARTALPGWPWASLPPVLWDATSAWLCKQGYCSRTYIACKCTWSPNFTSYVVCTLQFCIMYAHDWTALVSFDNLRDLRQQQKVLVSIICKITANSFAD